MTESLAGHGAGGEIRESPFELARQVGEFCKKLSDQGGAARQLTPQLMNCATSVATRLEEARGAESRRAFIAKCSIGLTAARGAIVRNTRRNAGITFESATPRSRGRGAL